MRSIFVFIGIGTIISLLFLLITHPFQLGMTPDSVSYIEVARNISEGKGVIDNQGELVQHWPPAYPILLGIASKVSGLDVIDVGVYFNLILILLYGILFIIVLRELKVIPIVQFTFIILLFFSLPSSEFLFFMSEGLFFVFLTLVLLLFMYWLRTNSVLMLLLAGLFSGFLLMTRYSGIGFIGGFVLYILLFGNKSIRYKLLQLFYYLIPIIIVSFFWVTYSLTFTKTNTSREISIHFIELSKINHGLYTFYSWFIGNAFILVILLILIVFLIYKLFQKNGYLFYEFIKCQSNYIFLLILPIITYLTFLILSISFVYANTPLDNRILSPVFIFLLLLLIVFLNYFLKKDNYKTLIYLFLAIIFISVPITSFNIWNNHYKNGSGYSGKQWRNSETLNYLKDSQDLKLYTNATDLVRLYAISKSEFIPIKIYPHKKRENPRYNDEFNKMKLEVEKGNKQILYFNKVSWRYYLMSKEELLKKFEEFDILHFNDGFLIK